MKRTNKSGHQKRLEAKKKALEQSAACSGQKTLFDMLSRPSSTSKTTLATTGQAHASMIDTTTETNNETTVTMLEEIQISSVPVLPQHVSSPDWYNEMKLDVNWLLKTHDCFEMRKEIKDHRNRPIVKCLVCSKYELQVRKMSANNHLSIANGVRVDGKDRLKHVVDHLKSSAHEEAIRLENCDQAWASKSDSHPWIKLFNKWHSEQLKFLVRIAVDAYNDSQVETLSARSWPSRSLSQDHSNYVLQHFESKGWDSEFEPFQPLASTYHYRDPLIYAEMRKIIGTQVMKQVAQCLKDCLCYSVQIDGSTDKQQVDSKFITARYVPFNEVSVNTVFLGIASSELGGAEGLLDSFKSCVERAAVQTDNLVGITTDGESANSGKNTGLWRLWQRYLGKDILTVWCVCHRSDLALEAVQSEVPELSV